MNQGGGEAIRQKDFKQPIDRENEKFVMDFLIGSLESALGDYRPREYYEDMARSEVTNLHEFHLKNIGQLQLDEWAANRRQ